MTITELLEQMLQECREKAADIESIYHRGILSSRDYRYERIRIAEDAYSKITEFCKNEGMNPEDQLDKARQALYEAVGIHIKKVPVRYYPGVEEWTGSLYYIYGLDNIETLFYDNDPVGKTFRFKKTVNIGEEKSKVDYYFEVKSEMPRNDSVSGDPWEGWKCFEGLGKVRGYHWAEGSVHIREYEGRLQSAAIQKIYYNEKDPIWKRRSSTPVERQKWIGICADIPEDLIIPEGGLYYDETLDPPRGLHYKEQGILAYDAVEEIVILGITDEDAEVVEIPREIEGRPVTKLDKKCFINCHKKLRKVILPDTLKEIGDEAFIYCENLEKPVIPPSVTKIGKDIFGPETKKI